MNILKIENNYSYLMSDDVILKETIWKALRFRERGYFHNAAYRMKKWDGFTCFFKKENGRFLTGLLPEVKVALKHLGAKYEIQDGREEFKFLYDSIDEDFMYPMKLRDYQVDYINQALRNKRGIVPSPPGSGKTSVMIGILKTLPPNTPTLVLANKKQLVEQNYEEITKWNIPNVGRFYSKAKEPNIITCSTVQSVHLLEKIFPKIKVLIVDEIHEMMSKTPKRIYNKLKNCPVRIAMSGTAFKFDGKDMGSKYDIKGWFGPMFTSTSTETGKITMKELQDREILSSSKCSFFEVNEPQLPYDVYLDAVTRGIAENEYFHGMVVKLVSKLAGRSLIMVERIEHGDRLHEKIPGALWVRGKDTVETRKVIIEQLRHAENVVVIGTSGIMNTGLNFPIHNLINAAGGQADHQIIQRFGRGLRTSEDKEGLTYYDFVFTINEYLEKHSDKRIKILKKEGYEVTVYKTIEDFVE